MASYLIHCHLSKAFKLLSSFGGQLNDANFSVRWKSPPAKLRSEGIGYGSFNDSKNASLYIRHKPHESRVSHEFVPLTGI